jgi:hypothetical protein
MTSKRQRLFMKTKTLYNNRGAILVKKAMFSVLAIINFAVQDALTQLKAVLLDVSKTYQIDANAA